MRQDGASSGVSGPLDPRLRCVFAHQTFPVVGVGVGLLECALHAPCCTRHAVRQHVQLALSPVPGLLCMQNLCRRTAHGMLGLYDARPETGCSRRTAEYHVMAFTARTQSHVSHAKRALHRSSASSVAACAGRPHRRMTGQKSSHTFTSSGRHNTLTSVFSATSANAPAFCAPALRVHRCDTISR